MNDMQMRLCGNGYMYCDGRCVHCKYVSYNTTNTSNTTVEKYGPKTTYSITQMPTTPTT